MLYQAKLEIFSFIHSEGDLYDSSVKLKLAFPRSVVKLTFCIRGACLTSDDFPISLKRSHSRYMKSIMALKQSGVVFNVENYLHLTAELIQQGPTH